MRRSRNSNHKNNDKSSHESGSVLSTNKNSARRRKKSKSTKGQWTIEGDSLLLDFQALDPSCGEIWSEEMSHIAQMLKGRIRKMCRERWHNHLRPHIKVGIKNLLKDLWTEEDDRILVEALAEVGNKWAEIAKRLPGGTENSI
ncbi:UNVERIFIED_CONTAM: Transcription factor [Sesamum radiatum]|uniref:Transcription factor n=1 Tax=Sesamum radiatum TaxID=300843 RepID=A0AAW2PIP3_SESRA